MPAPLDAAIPGLTMLRGASIQILKLCHLRYDRSHVGKQQESKEYEKSLT
jgi:hypothetical protein